MRFGLLLLAIGRQNRGGAAPSPVRVLLSRAATEPAGPAMKTLDEAAALACCQLDHAGLLAVADVATQIGEARAWSDSLTARKFLGKSLAIQEQHAP